MKEGLEDRVIAKVRERTDRLLDSLRKSVKNQKPAFQEPINPLEELYAFDQMTEADKLHFISQNGLGAWVSLMDRIDTIRRRYRR
jgi:hypothetical protein